MPKVSILTPAYKTNEKYLRQAIESILNQTFSDYEFIILDDCPEDISVEAIIRSYKDKRIRYIRNEKNLGISESRNKLINLAKGKYLAVFDHDDISLPFRIEQEVNYLDTHPQCGVVGSWYINEERHRGRIKKFPENHHDICRFMLHGMPMSHSSLMIRKSILTENNISYKKEFFPAEDYKLCADLMDITTFHNLPVVLLGYRNHHNNTSTKEATLMKRSDLNIKRILRNKYPDLWQEVQANKKTIKKIRLFSFFPLLTIEQKQDIKKINIFGFLPLYTSKIKTSY